MTTATQERPREKTPPAPPSVWPTDPCTLYSRAVVEREPAHVLPMIMSILDSAEETGDIEARARQIAAWTIVVGRAVRLACERHINDLKRQKTQDFPYYFDTVAAEHIIDFFPTFLPLESGAPFHLPPWLQFCYGFIYGWKCWGGERHGLRRIRHGFSETSKGSGKTPSAGGVAVYGAAYDDEPHAEIYCLAPQTNVLCSDFRWRPVGELRLGDGLVAFDEYPSSGGRRRLQPATVTSTSRIIQPCYRIRFEDGRSVVASDRHRWLGMKHAKGELKGWWETRDLRRGSRIRDLGQPWQSDESRDAGYLAGVYDGEGSFIGGGFRIAFSQRPGAVMDFVRVLLRQRGFNISAERSPASGVHTFEIRGLYDCLRFLGQIGPRRLVNGASRWLYRMASKSGSNGYATIADIEPIGNQEVVAIGTSTKTLFAEGLFSHNSTGFDKGQASIILNDAIRMVNDSPDEDFRREFIADKYNIAHPPSGSFIRAMSSQHQSKSGPRPHYVLSDEIHEHRDGTVVSKAEAGFKNRVQPLGLKYTNSGSDKTSYCWELHQKSLAILAGDYVDEQWFAYVCHLDPCDKHYEEGYRQPKDGCGECDNWRDPAVWPKIAPALGIVIQPKYLQDAIDTADSIPSQYSLVRRLNFCIWTETHQIWISSEQIEACKVEALSPTPSATAFAFDMSDKLDLTAGVAASRIDDAPDATSDSVEIVEVDGEKEITKTLLLNFTVDLVPYFWIPEETLLERVRKEHLPYDVWRRIPDVLRVTPGPIVDHDKIFWEYKDEIQPRHKATVTGYDDHHATQFGAALRDKAKLNAVEVPQGRKLSEAFKWCEALIRARRIRFLGNPILVWNFANCEVQSDRFRNIWVEKPTNTTKRIDGAVAAVMALSLLMAMPREKQFQAFIFGGGGKR